ncbi:glycosyltransferase [Eubacterium sp. 1001713B170207_170306_E7]|uniref:glycosyltransferase family 2 protein n=1 Tax=Eubacterium sp. 1001713B170207_170306_E7 TaxID=2787097 RepID=UPI00189B8788|nr:glycosyltransferase [Eubacterium sp. 1001713B170207_170306_E7]
MVNEKKKEPKISIIVPVYNVEKYLSRCIESLINQTLSDIEIILVNDASPDNSLSIMKKYQKQDPNRIVIIDSKVNKKQGGARNLGLAKACGEYICFVDSDDWVEKKLCEKVYERAISTNAEIIFYDALETKDGIQGIYLKMADEKNMGIITEEKRRRLILNPGSCWAKVYKRCLLLDNEIKYPENIFYEDNCQAHIPMLYVKKCDYIKEPLYNYFQDNINSTTKSVDIRKMSDRCQSAMLFIQEVQHRKLYETYKDEIDYVFLNYFYFTTAKALVLRFKKVPKKFLKK